MSWFHRHRWRNWEVDDKRILLRSEDKAQVGWIILQSRTCSKCELTQYRTERVMVD